MHRLLVLGLLLLLACNAPPETDDLNGSGEKLGVGDPQAGGGSAVVITTQTAGIYELSATDLAPYGLADQPEKLRLFLRGEQQPLWLDVQDDDFRLRFYAQESNSLYVRGNRYWLEADGMIPPLWMRTENLALQDALVPSSDHALVTLRLEENLRYAPQVENGEHFFWVRLPAPTTHAVQFDLPQVASGPATVKVAVWASTQAPQEPDHHLRLSINGAIVADETWDGIGRHTVQAALPSGALHDANNELIIEIPGDTAATAEIQFLDWIEIGYARSLVGGDGQLAFAGGTQPLQLIGFPRGGAVFDVTDPQQVRIVAIIPQNAGEVFLQGANDAMYLAAGPSGYLSPELIRPAVTAPDIQTTLAGVDYLAVGPGELLEPLQPLLDRRRENDLKTLAVPLEAVYDQFNHGLPEPQAVQKLIRLAGGSPGPSLQYLLLVGDATYDPRGYLSAAEANRLPTFLVNTVFGGETATDIPFGQLNGDPWPDIAVGRLPARAPDQVRAVVGKILSYEENNVDGDWQGRILAVADGQEPSFRADAQRFLDQFSQEYQLQLYAPDPGAADVNQEVRRKLADGASLVAYFGHGSVTQWGKDSIFTTEDSIGLGNGDRLPIVVNMTCLTGLFTHPEVDSLAEALLWEPEGGAVAVLAPTSLTLPSDQSFLSEALVRELQGDSTATLGQINQRALRQVPVDSLGGRDVMQTFLLFGDPALRLARP